MASVLNNSARKYSLAVTVKGAVHLLKVLPGVNTFSSCKASGLNKSLQCEADFEFLVGEAAKLEYVKVLQEMGVLFCNVKPAVLAPELKPMFDKGDLVKKVKAPESKSSFDMVGMEPEPEKAPKPKMKKSKKKGSRF